MGELLFHGVEGVEDFRDLAPIKDPNIGQTSGPSLQLIANSLANLGNLIVPVSNFSEVFYYLFY